MNYYVKADRFLLEDMETGPAYLQIINGKFGLIRDFPSDEDAKIIDWSGYTIAPGLFDTHIHGGDGVDVMDGDANSIHQLSDHIVASGVTRFLPTTLTSSIEDLENSVGAVRQAVEEGLRGAQSEGVFLEGPFFTEKYKGAQNPAYFLDPDYNIFSKLQDLSGGMIRKIALAPERAGSLEFIQQMVKEGVAVGLAHTDASSACCQKAHAYGASIYVHLFNGMKGLHHREPGVVGAGLNEKEAFTELICDGHHVHPEVVGLVENIKKDKLLLITDCMRAGGKPDGTYMLGEFEIQMEDGVARTESGSLAGSTLRLIDGVKNIHYWANIPLHESWQRASLSPAKSLGLHENLGSIEEGKAADFVVLDKDMNIKTVAINGVEIDKGEKGNVQT
ncbi:N-acetylglucosamine-6-phosphate deacetylase [Natribacillus halophilus]|uniref:N-acetylglucosamine-6-phosphate deacetylase n=1 Tax=Natribacillus halophilus TaxID=549003 RepID=A0A1G8N2P0_9BACI|nr:N-acetylglucosamine-6-phosphate deacetylase [Natribacillus halophilus]SDI74433.1 N-acetylglucosamine-6-phosphate deacetylase [Natribacillus halophilus]